MPSFRGYVVTDLPVEIVQLYVLSSASIRGKGLVFAEKSSPINWTSEAAGTIHP